MFIALCLSALLQSPSVPETKVVTHQPAHPALAAKALGAPGYGLQLSTPTGKFMLTNLSHHPVTHQVGARTYRIGGNAGLGPYRLGLKLAFHADEQEKNIHGLNPIVFGNYFYINGSEEGSPAREAGLKSTWTQGWFIENVDGKNFGWNLEALIYYLSNSPEVAINAAKYGMLGGISRKTFRIQNRKVETPVDPGDGVLLDTPSPPEVKAWLGDSQTWKDLLILRSRQERFTPLLIDLAGRKLRVVQTMQDYGTAPPAATSRALEFWTEDPATGPYRKGLLDVWPEPEGGLQAGQSFRVEERWYRLQALTQNPATGRLTAFEFRPWEADVPSLLGGATLAKELGSLQVPSLRESIEQAANTSLVVWKTRTLPNLLATQGLGPTEDLVIQLEQGLLMLDLEVKGIRSRLDARARAEAEQKAQAGLAAKEGKQPLQALPPLAESERLADLLEQRKAILMAVLGSAKQSLANLRR